MASKRRWRKPLIILACSLTVVYVGICAYMYFAQESFLFRPTVVAANVPWDLTLEEGKGLERSVEELNFPSELDGQVNALHFTCDSARGAILYLHGNGGNAGICARNRNKFLAQRWEFFIPDYRGYGKSTGPMSQAGLDADVEAAWNQLNKRYPANQIIIYGQSMGSGYATRLAAKHTPKLLILEAPYTSLVDVAHSQYPWLPVRWLMNYPSEALEFVDDVQCPVVVFHGDQDEVIPYAQGVEMANAAVKGQLITLPGQGHKHVQDNPLTQKKLEALLH
jgi:uncharacterized protein